MYLACTLAAAQLASPVSWLGGVALRRGRLPWLLRRLLSAAPRPADGSVGTSVDGPLFPRIVKRQRAMWL